MVDAMTQVRSSLERLVPLLEGRLCAHLEHGTADQVGEAMRYSLAAGGKRVRPALCMLACEALGGKAETALNCAMALEYIHTYSLIHDDLPAMDDDDLRRGKPTCHIAYGEGQAILAGDGLLTEAFALLAGAQEMSAEQRMEAVAVLAQAAGWQGMVGGQSLDLEGEKLREAGATFDLDHLKRIHRLKTGALIRASLEMGAIAAGASAADRKLLREVGEKLGLAFQIQDDILDATSTSEQMGKRVGKDEGKGKMTYPALLGLEGSRQALQEATQGAMVLLEKLPEPQMLQAWAMYLAQRGA